jgi:hypothetical protein
MTRPSADQDLLPDTIQARLHAHINHLAGKHDLVWHETLTERDSSVGCPDVQSFYTPPLVRERVYWEALHEIAHLVLGLATFAADGVTVCFENELRVWERTLACALISPSAPVWEELEMMALRMYPNQTPSPQVERGMKRLGPNRGASMRFNVDTDRQRCG